MDSEVMKGLSECKASESNIRRIRVKDIVKEVKDYLKAYSSAGMDISWYVGNSISPKGATKGDLSCQYEVGKSSEQLAQLFTKGQIQGFPGDLSLGIAFPGNMSPGISGMEKLEWDSFSGDIPERHRRAQIVSVKQLSATVDGFPGRHVARDTKIN
ncbi:hypothetical protein Tco_1225040 [Tanacetum coccineum]